jgi:hypothetical protein
MVESPTGPSTAAGLVLHDRQIALLTALGGREPEFWTHIAAALPVPAVVPREAASAVYRLVRVPV